MIYDNRYQLLFKDNNNTSRIIYNNYIKMIYFHSLITPKNKRIAQFNILYISNKNETLKIVI